MFTFDTEKRRYYQTSIGFDTVTPGFSIKHINSKTRECDSEVANELRWIGKDFERMSFMERRSVGLRDHDCTIEY